MTETIASERAFGRLRRFLAKPAAKKLESLTFRLRSIFPAELDTIELPFGAKWILAGSALDHGLRNGQFETAEIRFVERVLRPGMIVLDIGAHHGLYTLLAAGRVRPNGRVIAFEPSPRERKRLRRHVRLNSCSNVRIEEVALAGSSGEAEFFLVQGAEDYCNSLRPPAVKASTRTVRIRTVSLDEFMKRRKLRNVDFIKIDTEGAELEVLKGANGVLRAQPRPVLLIEVAEIRTAPWGYSAREIVHFMNELEYLWFSIRADGSLSEMRPDHDLQDTNLVAIPKERSDVAQLLLGIDGKK